MLAGTLNCVAFLVKQVLDFENRLDILAPVHAMVRAHLLGGNGGKLRLPIAENVLLEAGELGDLTDAKVELGRQFFSRPDAGGEIGRIKAKKVVL